MATCKGKRADGQSCKNPANGEDFCYRHKPDAESEPYKFDAEAKTEYLALLEEVPIVKTCAEAVGITRQTVHNHRKSDREFALQERIALGKGRIRLAKEVRSAEWLLSKSDPETFTDRQSVDLNATVRDIRVSSKLEAD